MVKPSVADGSGTKLIGYQIYYGNDFTRKVSTICVHLTHTEGDAKQNDSPVKLQGLN
jgi:hypothetical protein